MLAVARIVLIVLTALLVVGTLLPFIRKPYWWVRSLDFPRIQIAGLAVLVLVGQIVVVGLIGRFDAADTWASVGLGAVIVYQTWRMLPYSRFWKVQTVRAENPDRARSLRLVVSNVLMTNRDADLWHRVIGKVDPDVVAAVETDAWWKGALQPFHETHPHAIELPQEDTYGMCLYSRFPLEDAQVRHLVEPEVPSLFVTVRLPSGEGVRLVVLHPRPPRPDTGQDSTFRDAELVLAAREVAEMDRPVVVCGDLNDVAWSETTTLFQRLAGLLDPRVGRGLFSTFHANHRLLRYPLDHVFHSDDLGLVSLARLGNVGSDHFPMCVELALCADAKAEQEPPAETAEAREMAADVLDEARETLAEETPAEAAERKAEDV